MLGRLSKIFRRKGTRGAVADLPSVPREEIGHLLRTDHGLPHVDWGAAEAWIGKTERDPSRAALRRRAVAAAWLDELRDSLQSDHRRWRRERVEGLAPLEGSLSARTAGVADKSIATIEKALKAIRGEAPIPPVGVVAIASNEEYYSLVSHYYSDEGEWATSGGVYINQGADSFPMLVMNAQLGWAIEKTVAHELTHHALHGAGLPLWVEEGLTQMMEERVTGHTDFKVDHDSLRRHRERWEEIGLERLWSGEAFHSPEEDEQELAYHMAQLLVRGILAQRAREFFEFARACGELGVEGAAAEHLGGSLDSLAERALAIG